MRARYYDSQTGRFISRDPIGQIDDVNLYNYVGNNSVMYIDLLGLTKYLILQGEDKEGDNSLYLGALYQQKKLLEQGIKPRNIILYSNVKNPEDINWAIEQHKGNIQEIIFITHGSSTSLGLNGEINKDNIGSINLLNEKSCSATKVTIIACNAGKGDESIAQDLSNELGASVNAPNGYVGITTNTHITSQLVFPGMIDGFEERGEPSLYAMQNIINIIKRDLKYNNFNPN